MEIQDLDPENILQRLKMKDELKRNMLDNAYL